uniref:Uncharacterized protein n=1 Tax=viral metagenome TaxID=1070528 RepID=A0A6C0JSY7_9ZZZZ
MKENIALIILFMLKFVSCLLVTAVILQAVKEILLTWH